MPGKILLVLRRNWDKIYFSLAVLGAVFIVGMLVGRYRLFPFPIVSDAWQTAKQLVEVKVDEPSGLNPIAYANYGVTKYSPEEIWRGPTLISGPFKDDSDWAQELRLIDVDGNVLHRWTIHPETLWDVSPHDDPIRGTRNSKNRTYVHGAVLMSSGDVVFNFSHYALVRIDACSNVLWKIPHRAHHSVDTDDDGNFWVAGETWRTEPVARFSGLSTPFIEDIILKVSPDGEILREISLLDVLYDSGYEGLLFSGENKHRREYTHMNDVEILSAKMAPDFDAFEAGDILVSLRNINSLLVIDSKSERVKWISPPVLIYQHDPDFLAGGYITSYDNRPNRLGHDAPEFGGSRIVQIRPDFGEVEVIVSSTAKNEFDSSHGGKHQNLPNGNILIVEPERARIFEVNRAGDLVWSWVADRWDNERAPEFLEGTRYPGSYGKFNAKCN